MKRPALRFVVSALVSCLILIALNLAAAKTISAQDLDNVTFSGRIVDQNNAVIPGATVETVLIKTNTTRTAVSDEQGRYRIIQLEPGVYTLRISATGFATQEKQELTTIAGQNVQLDITLLPQGVAAGLEVTSAETPAVDTTRTVVGGTVTTHEVEALPVSTRSPLDLIFTLGGVTEEPLSTRDLAEDRNSANASTPEEAGTFSLSGGPAYSNNITIDGLDNNDDRAARERFQPSIEGVEEVQVITNQFSAEYGRASGGRINIKTRGGSNKYRGRGFYFFRDDWLNANTFNNNRIGVSRLPFTEQNPGFTLSGPLTLPKFLGPLSYNGSSKTFFFTAYEYSTISDSALINTFVPVAQNPVFPLPAPTSLDGRRLETVDAPSAAGEIAPFIQGLGTPQRNHIFTTRVDHKFGDLHNGAFLLQLGRLTDLRQFGGGDRLAEALQARTRKTDAISYSDNFVFSATAVNQARIQFSRLTPAIEARGGSRPVVIIDFEAPPLLPGEILESGTLVAGSSTIGATDRQEDRIQFQDIFAYVRGAHSLKLGGDMQRIKSTFIDLSDASGTYSFDSAGDFLAGQASRFRQNFLTTSEQQNTYVGLFASDEVRLASNLVVTLGLRWENETILIDRNNFAPRVAAAWDPFKSGKTVIRVGAGIFYNRALLRTIDDFTLGAQQRFFDTDDLIDPATGLLANDAFRREFIRTRLQFPQVLNADSEIVRQFGVLNTGFSRRLDPTLRIPESYQANVGFERELGKTFVFEANYTWNRGLHLWREFNANAPRLPAGFNNFTEFLASRDFVNFPSASGTRPIYSAGGAGDLVRFVFGPFNPANPARCTGSFNPTNPDSGGCVNEFGVPVTLFNLNSFSSTTTVDAALAALNGLRPDPGRGEVEQLISVGNSFYHGLTLELRRRFRSNKNGFAFSFRGAYTLSKLRDDGIVNTSNAVESGNFQAERSRSLLDRRHRFVFSGTFDTPRYLGKLRISPIWRIASGAPFNISAGVDRNLDDVSNDRPIFTGDMNQLRWRARGEPLDPAILNAFSLPPIGGQGNLPRNAGQGPGQFFLDLNITREFRVSEKMRLRPVVEFDNVLNKTVYSFGSEFISFTSLSPTATPAQRQAFQDSFLVATRTLRPRQVRLGIRFDF
ncbi:MAG TPA: carboxypeptidase regulatory-like domain-containing protein [Pyrinomonadaceae bacterium]|nr:carboxypeptidase regulatory-like domain-containing protein [Pyrinomonadaceae bacterium]